MSNEAVVAIGREIYQRVEVGGGCRGCGGLTSTILHHLHNLQNLPLAQKALQRSGATHMSEPGERFFFELAHALPGNAEQRPDFLERHRLLAFEEIGRASCRERV